MLIPVHPWPFLIPARRKMYRGEVRPSSKKVVFGSRLIWIKRPASFDFEDFEPDTFERIDSEYAPEDLYPEYA